MRDSYYVIELSARWLALLLMALALLMILAFALGYGAAWSSRTTARMPPEMAALQAAAPPTAIPEVVIPTEVPVPTEPVPPQPSSTPAVTPEPTAVPTATASATPAVTEFYVQVLASSRRSTVDAASSSLEELGFSRDYQHLITSAEDDGGMLYKLRIGPFPDRNSADRVAQRMSSAGFPDAWVVAP